MAINGLNEVTTVFKGGVRAILDGSNQNLVSLEDQNGNLIPATDISKYTELRKEVAKFQSDNPPNGVHVTYSLNKSVADEDISLKIYNESNQEVANLEASGETGVHRVVCSFDRTRGRGRRGGRPGPGFEPGRYFAVLTVSGEEYEQGFDVIADPILKTKTGPAR